MKKFLFSSVLSVFFLLMGFFIFFLLSFRTSKPKSQGKITLNALSNDVRVVRDSWGVPHLFAQDEKDLFFAMGFVHAQERMWQMDILRRAGFGRLAEVFGVRGLERDKVMRNLGLREAAQKDLENLTEELEELLWAYSRGVNSWRSSRKFKCPPEFLLLRFRPEPWSPLDTLIIREVLSLLLCVDYQSEIFRAELVQNMGEKKALQILEDDIKPVSFLGLEDVEFLSSSSFGSLGSVGSNSWVVDGQHTKSGMPLLANDPHLEITIPPIWYQMDLHSPSLRAAGVTFPGVPLIIIGRNDSITWGLTNSGADVQDLYVEKIDLSGSRYLDHSGWKPLLIKEEVIKIRGKKEPEKLEILWTGRGPILSPLVIKSESPLSLRWTAYDGSRIVESIYLLNKARNWEEFRLAVELFDTPSQNFIYADTQGNIGYYLSGKIPLRPKEAALFPYPGWRKKGEWQGYIEEDRKPTIFNPQGGLIVAANNKIIPDDYPFYVSCDWDAPFRARRIEELLLQREKHDVDSFKKIQNDVFSKRGEFILSVIRELKLEPGKAQNALEMLQSWDLEMRGGREAAFYHAFENFFHQEVFEDELGEDFETFDRLFRRKQAGLLRILSDPHSSWYDRLDTVPVEGRKDVLQASLVQAYEWLENEYGSQEKWDWEKINAIIYNHALGQVPWLMFFNRGPFPVPGDAFTVRVSFRMASGGYLGASYRQIIDLADLRNSQVVLTSGQSGHFLSPHYDDQIPLWLEGKYRPMLTFPEDVDANAYAILLLKAGGKKE